MDIYLAALPNCEEKNFRHNFISFCLYVGPFVYLELGNWNAVES